jgi:hypothetical protein
VADGAAECSIAGVVNTTVLSMFGRVQKQGQFSLCDWRSHITSDHKIEYLLDTYWEAAIKRELILNPFLMA